MTGFDTKREAALDKLVQEQERLGLYDPAPQPAPGYCKNCKDYTIEEPLYAQPVQEPVSFPCCGYTDANAIRWNQFNGVVQCHMCGQVYTVAQPAQEPLARVMGTYGGMFVVAPLNPAMVLPDGMALYSTPQHTATWVGLTDEDIADCIEMSIQKTCRAIEAKLKDKNT